MGRPILLIILTVLFYTPVYGEENPAIFEGHSLHDVYIEMEPSDWQALRDNYLLDTKYDAAFFWNEFRAERVQVRSRGSSSRNPTKPSLRVDFDAYDKQGNLGGLKRLVLDNLSQDPGLVKERLSMKLFHEMGLAAPRVAHGKLFVNGQFAGVYGIVEPIDEQFLNRVLGESGGYLYEYNAIEPYYFGDLGDDPAMYIPERFEPKTHEKDPAPNALIDFIRRLNQDRGLEQLSERFDIAKFVRYVAVEQYLAEVDGINGWDGANNFYIYHAGDPAYFHFFPWDKDLTFHDAARSIVSNFEDNIITRQIWQDPELRRLYVETLRRIASDYGGAGGWLEREMEFAFRQVRSAALEDPLLLCADGDGTATRCQEGVGPFEDEIRRLREFIQTRNEHIYAELSELETAEQL